MKRNIMTALLITAMISTMTACGNKNTDATTETVTTTETAVTATEETITTEVATQDQIATLPLTDEDNPVVDATPSPDPKASDAPKTTADPKASTKPVVTETAKPNTQASATTTATTKPVATEKPQSTTAPAPKATAAPKATPAPTAAPVACQHTNTHVESSHDTYEVPIAGGCYEVWRTATRVCNDCGANLGENQEKVNEVHTNVVHKQGVSATCTTDGYTQVCGCDCGRQPEVGGDVIPAFGHDYHDVCTDEISEDLTQVKWETVCYICGDVAKTWWE